MSIQDVPYILSSQERLDRLGREDSDNDGTAEAGNGGITNGQKTVGPDGNQYYPLPLEPMILSDTKDEEPEDANDVYEKAKCGVGPWQPAWCARLASLNVFVITYGIAGIWMTTLSSLLASQITSIERHLGLSSSQTGLILSSNEIGYLLVILIGSHFGKYTHIPRFLSISGICFGIFPIIMSFGRFVEPSVWKSTMAVSDSMENASEPLNPASKYLCDFDLSRTANISSDASMPSAVPSIQIPVPSVTWGYWLLVFCALMGGMVKSYRIPLLTFYVETNIKDKARTGFLLGISFTAMVFGPPIALFLGAYVSSLPLDLNETSMSGFDQRWIGAWWLGFIIVGVACVVFSLPIMFFPRKVLVRKAPEKKRRDEDKMVAARKMLLDLPKSLARVFRRPIYVLTIVISITNGFAFAGYFAFSQKYIETQFNKTSQETSMTTGIVLLVALVIGTFSGGYLSTRLKLRLRGCIIFTLSISAFTLGLDTLFLVFGCDNSDVVGVVGGSTASLSEQCACNDDIFLVCGDNNVDYRSPCLAGCTNITGMLFSNCTDINDGQARPGLCELDCDFFIPFLIVKFIGILLGCTSIVPGFMLIVRSVATEDQPVATGTCSFCQTLIGVLPSPLMFGKLIDDTCKLWSPSGGYCLLYDRVTLRYHFHGVSIGLRGVEILVLVAMLWILHRQRRKQGEEEEEPRGKDENT